MCITELELQNKDLCDMNQSNDFEQNWHISIHVCGVYISEPVQGRSDVTRKNSQTPPVLFILSSAKTAPDLASSDTEECDITI